MVELSQTEFQNVKKLFRKVDHSAAVIHAVLEGNSPGKVYADNQVTPTVALLFPEGTFYYAAGNENSAVLNHDLVPLLFDRLVPESQEKEMVLFSFSDAWRDKLDRLLRSRGVIRISRKVFGFNIDKFKHLPNWKSGIQDGFRMRKIDVEFAEQYPAFKAIVDPRSKRLGVCLTSGDEIVCDCSSIHVGNGEAEIGISTNEKYQGKGYATLTGNAFIEDCIDRGLKPSWSCWPERRASVALAKALGFDELPDAQAHYWTENVNK